MIVNSAYMYMGKQAPKEIHLFANGNANYPFSKISGTSTIDLSGLTMYSYASCKFSEIPLTNKNKITINFNNLNYPQSSGFYLRIRASEGQSLLFTVGKSTSEKSAIFELELPIKAKVENAVIEIDAQAYGRHADIAIN